MPMFRKRVFAICAALLLFVVPGCADDDDDDGAAAAGDRISFTSESGLCSVVGGNNQDLYMGIMHSIGGDVWPVPELRDIMTMALEEINAGGGLGGKSLGAILCDAQCKPDIANTAMLELLKADSDDNGIDLGVIAGPGCSYVAMNAAADGGGGTPLFDMAGAQDIVMIGLSTEGAGLTAADTNDWYFRTITSGAVLGGLQGIYLANEDYGPGLEKLAVVYIDDAWGQIGDIAGQSFAGVRGADNYLSIPYTAEDLDSTTALADIDTFMGASTSDDVGVFVVGYDADTAFSGFFKAIPTHAWGDNGQPFWELSSGATDAFFATVGDAGLMVGLGGVTQAKLQGEGPTHWASAVKAKTGKDSQTYWGEGYDGIYMAAIGMAIAEHTLAGSSGSGAAVRAGLRKSSTGTKAACGNWAGINAAIQANGTVDYEGAAGPVDFDANGDVSTLFTHQEFDADGKYQLSGCWVGDGTVATGCAE